MTEGSIIKMIGKKKEEVNASQVYNKLYALQEMIPAVMHARNKEGQLREDLMDSLTYGITLLFRDALTEFDQICLDGIYGRTAEEIQTSREQIESHIRAARTKTAKEA